MANGLGRVPIPHINVPIPGPPTVILRGIAHLTVSGTNIENYDGFERKGPRFLALLAAALLLGWLHLRGTSIP